VDVYLFQVNAEQLRLIVDEIHVDVHWIDVTFTRSR